VKTVLRVALWVAAAVVLLIAAAVVVMHFIDWRQHANSVAAVVEEQTGRRLEIGGPVKVGIFPVRVLIDDVTFANAPGGSRDVMVKVKRVGARFKLADLIRGNLALGIDLSEPDVLLETVASGEKNWSLTFDVPAKLAFAQLKVSGGQIVFREHPSGDEWRLVVEKLSIQEKLAGGYAGRLEARLNDFPVEVDVDVKPGADVNSTQDALAIEGRASISEATLDFDGQAFKEAKVTVIKGKLQADIPDPQVLGKLFQSPLPGLPSVSLATSITASGQQISVDDLKAAIGKSSFSGKIRADLAAKRPRIDGTVSAQFLDMAELTGSSKKALKEKRAKAPGAGGRMISTRPLGLPPLDMADIKLNLAVEKLRAARDVTVQNLQAAVFLEGGRLTVKPLKMAIAGADFTFTGNADGWGRANAKLSASLNANGVDLGELLKALTGKKEFEGGRTQVSATLQASGESPAKLASTLKGHVRISVGPGRLSNRNLDELLGDVFSRVINTIDPFYVKENTSELKCLAVNVPIRDGVVLIDDTVALETTKIGLSLAGFVNLNTEEIDLLARPMAKEGLGIGADLLSDLVRIRGTLANPQTDIDPAGVAKTTVFRGIDVATFGLTALARGLTSKISADEVCAEALRVKQAPPSKKSKKK
jgi:uncharacterized protein involved in outer membrane biogenesis